MTIDSKALKFVEEAGSAAMITLRKNGTPVVARVGVGVIDGKVWSSGTKSRVRTRHLRRDSRSTLFVFESGTPGAAYRYLGLESTVTILDGPEAPQLNLRLFQGMQARLPTQPPEGRVMWFGQSLTMEEFLAKMVEEGRLIYQFEVKRAYGMY